MKGRNKKRSGGGVSKNASIVRRTRSNNSKKKQKVLVDDDDDKNNDDTVVVASTSIVLLTLMSLPDTARYHIWNYVGDNNKQKELHNLTLLSKQVNKDCKHPSIEWKLVLVFQLSPLEDNGGHTIHFFQNLGDNQEDDDTNSILQDYSKMIVNVPQIFHRMSLSRPQKKYISNLKMYGIESLHFCKAIMPLLQYLSRGRWLESSLPLALSYIVPNLQELMFSSHLTVGADVIKSFSDQCPRLEKLTYKSAYPRASGCELKNSADTLRQLTMDGSTFHVDFREIKMMSDLHNHPTTFLFHECNSKVLERVSICDAKYNTNVFVTYENGPPSIPQGALIKFIRNAPSTLKWFRSDLKSRYINMLREERPGIEFLN